MKIMINQVALKQIANSQLLNGGFCLDRSLFDGKMGIALFFFFYAQSTHNNWYEEFAGELLDDICNNLHTNLPITFADGLCGIGWGIEFLKKQGFIEGDTDEILSEIDLKIMERNLLRISDTSFETGLEGIVAYTRSRLDRFRAIQGKQCFDSTYLRDLEAACQKANIQFDKYSMDAVWNRILSLFSSTVSLDGKDSWKRGLTMIGANV